MKVAWIKGPGSTGKSFTKIPVLLAGEKGETEGTIGNISTEKSSSVSSIRLEIASKLNIELNKEKWEVRDWKWQRGPPCMNSLG
jgi:hypothetical protein